MKIDNRSLKAILGSALMVASFLQTAFPLAAAEHHGVVKFGGLPVPGVTVTATQGDKKVSVVTEQDGSYSFPDLADGTWTIEADMLGFTPGKHDVTLKPTAVVGATEPSPDIELKMLALEEMKATSAGSIVVGLTSGTPTTPGAPATPPANTAAANRNNTPARNNTKQVVPAASSQAGFQRAEVRATPAGAAAAQAPPADAPPSENTAELSQRAQDGYLVNGSSVNGASSQFAFNPAIGNNRRGVRSLYNGNVGINFSNSALNARDYSLTGADTPKPESTQFTANANFGGPIKIPHLVKNGPNFTVNYSWTRNRQARTQSGLMPTDADRMGDFSSRPVQIKDLTGAIIPGNQLQAGQISPQAAALLSLFPHPNVLGNPAYNYQIALVSPTHVDSLNARSGKQLGRKNNININGAFQSSRSDNPSIFAFQDRNRSLGFNFGVSLTHRFTTRHSGTFGAQYSRQASRSVSFFENRQNFSGLAGITGNNQEPVNWGPPSLSFAGGSGIFGLNDGLPSFTRNQTATFNYDGSWTHGRHTIGYGGDYRLQQFNTLSQQNPRGSFGFNGNNTGFDFSDFLQGVPDTSAIAFGNADKYFRAKASTLYTSDDYRVNASLSMNLGLVWAYNSPITELYGRLVNLDVAPGFTSVAPVVANNPVGSLTRMQYPDALVHPVKTPIQPRVGIAWRPISGQSLLIRAGYSVSYNTGVYQSIASQMAQQSPLSKSLSINSTESPLTLANGFSVPPNKLTNTFAVDPNFRIGYAQQWFVSLQRDLPFALQMVAQYTGIKGTRGAQGFYPNTFAPGTVNACTTCPSGFTYLTSNGNSTREAGSLQLRRRLQRGFTANLNYTYSKSIDDSSLGGSGVGGLVAQNWLNLAGERGLSSFDQRHVLNFSVQYTSGLGIGGGILSKGWRAALLKEWTIVSQLTLGSGTPLTPSYSGTIVGTGNIGSLRPNYVGGDIYAAPDGRFLNPAAFAVPAAGQWGNIARNSIIGPDKFSLNAQMTRTFRMSDRISLDLGIQANNPLNRVVISSWNTNISSLQQFGVATGAGSMRSVTTTLRMRF